MGRSNGRLRRKPGDDHSGLRWLHPPVALRPAPVRRGHGTVVFQIKPTPDRPRESAHTQRSSRGIQRRHLINVGCGSGC